jgi:dTDP-4-amino-4,6-dideoxygalactose transaminase
LGNEWLTSTGELSTSLALALYISGLRPGDEVLASPLTCLATVMPVANLFGKVVWCDIDQRTGGLDPLDVERRVTPRTKAILVYDWAGNPCDLGALQEVARRNGLSIVEDAGEALGAEYGGRKVGNCGVDFTVFSFYPNRHLTTGDGAAITFADPEVCARARRLKRYGIDQPSFRDAQGEISRTSDILEPGLATYLSNLAATLGLAQLPHLPQVVGRHQNNGKFYDRVLPSIEGITTFKRRQGSLSAFWVYTFYCERRDDLLTALRARGVLASKVHLRNDLYSCFGGAQGKLPGVDYFDLHALSIPCGWWVTDEDREYIVEALKAGW